ncbi:hypothetical protein HN371_08060 [Candidatus Poribacteria bacterium]|jgi:hypothetical protein|nr:hypothetical protein [Candidatus Poribacteria bacterium]MBT5534860.1 hypothetical protein [Candidatus Poribacteria bacterium]MBT7805360.1 hypothetical protein [Candidatus Poribacteria bacterium]
MFRRRKRGKEPLNVDFINWIDEMPEDAQLLLYEGGAYVGKEHAHRFGSHGEDLEMCLLRQFGAGEFTVTPHYNGHLHTSRPARVGDPDDVYHARMARRRERERQLHPPERMSTADKVGMGLKFATEMIEALTPPAKTRENEDQ